MLNFFYLDALQQTKQESKTRFRSSSPANNNNNSSNNNNNNNNNGINTNFQAPCTLSNNFMINSSIMNNNYALIAGGNPSKPKWKF
jgi:hypothetical protein